MRPDWAGVPCDDPAERRGLPYAEPERDGPDLAPGYPPPPADPMCHCGCPSTSTHHRKVS